MAKKKIPTGKASSSIQARELLHLGIEAGGTKTIALVANSSLKNLQRWQYGAANLRLISDAALLELLRRIGADVPNPASVGIGMAGLRDAADRSRVQKLLNQIWPGIPAWIGNDLEIALAASGQNTPAQVLVLSGTGSCCFGRSPEGTTVKIGGWGHIIGDKGSGYEIGLRALKAVVFYYDRDEIWSELGKAILRRLSLNSPNDLIGWAQHAGKSEIAALAVDVFQSAGKKDKIARDILEGAANSLAKDGASCARRLAGQGKPVEFILAGSVLLKQPKFSAEVGRLLKERWPEGTVCMLQKEAVWGALLAGKSRAAAAAVHEPGPHLEAVPIGARTFLSANLANRQQPYHEPEPSPQPSPVRRERESAAPGSGAQCAKLGLGAPHPSPLPSDGRGSRKRGVVYGPDAHPLSEGESSEKRPSASISLSLGEKGGVRGSKTHTSGIEPITRPTPPAPSPIGWERAGVRVGFKGKAGPADELPNPLQKKSSSIYIPSPSKELSPTEQRNRESVNLDKVSIAAAVKLMLSEEAKVIPALAAEERKIAKAISIISNALRKGGRLFYVGAGTSGRLGVLDASECPPTFRTNPDLVQGIIAGGQQALWQAVEGAEDDAEAGAEALKFRGVTKKDVVVGIAASGRTPFVWGAFHHGRKAGAQTILVCFNPFLKFEKAFQPSVVIAPKIGPEVLTGSSRLKSGTATKLILNMFTTLSMVQMGKVMSNLMVDLNPSNVKLRDRAARIVMEVTGSDRPSAEAALLKTNWMVKEACKALNGEIDSRKSAVK